MRRTAQERGHEAWAGTIDYRPGHPGNRTDAIMVVSVAIRTGAVSAASIPRDTVNFPLPGGTAFRPKVNALYQEYVGRLGTAAAMEAMEHAVGNALGVELDGTVVIGFTGVVELVDAVGGLDVTLEKAVVDPAYWLSPTRRGVRFPAGPNHLDGERTLIFARTRKGDNDFERARRQQQVISAAVAAVRRAGPPALARLLTVVAREVKTDLSFAEAARIFEIASTARVDDATRVVLGPRRRAGPSGGTSFALEIDAVRDWTARYMGPVAAAAASLQPGGTSEP